MRDWAHVKDLTTRRVGPDLHDEVMRYFDLVAYADNPAWARCYCMERLVNDYDARTREQNRADRSAPAVGSRERTGGPSARPRGWLVPRRAEERAPGCVGRAAAGRRRDRVLRGRARLASAGHRDGAARRGPRAPPRARVPPRRGVPQGGRDRSEALAVDQTTSGRSSCTAEPASRSSRSRRTTASSARRCSYVRMLMSIPAPHAARRARRSA